MVSSRNFSIKRIGSLWRVVGPGGKLINGAYRREQQALQALKVEVDKFFDTHKFGFVKDTALQIEKELTRIQQLEEENARNIQGHGKNDQKDAKSREVTQGHEGRQENDEGIALQIARERQEKSKKRKK